MAMGGTMRQVWVGLRFLAVMTLALGILYPLAVFGVGRLVPSVADGSFVTDANGSVVGSRLIGQSFTGSTWFWPRPSAAGTGYDAESSGGSNLSADNRALVQLVHARLVRVASADGVAPGLIPSDAVTASASGLDPDISPAYAMLQVARVSRARGLDTRTVAALVQQETQGRLLGFIGEPHVNVLALNLALSRLT